MTLTKAKLLKDAKEELKKDLDKNKGSFHLLMQSFASDSCKNRKTDYENQKLAKEIYIPEKILPSAKKTSFA